MTPTEEVADALYALPPQGFTAARDAEVAAARAAGDKARATELAALKRPSQSAWLVNLVALRHPDTIDALVALGQTIRDAQGSVTPQQLRDLSARRRTELDAALALAGSLATEAAEPAPTRAQLAEVEGTLAAAMADPDAATLVRAGRVLKALTYSGFGVPAGSAGGSVGSLAVGRSSPRPPSGGTGTSARSAAGTATTGAGTGGPATGPKKAAAVDEAAQAEQAERAAAEAAAAKARLTAATERVEQAQRAHAGAVEAEQDLQARTEALAAEIAERTARLDALHRDARAARQARLAAERDLASAQRRLDRLAEPS